MSNARNRGGYTIKRRITLPQLKLVEGEEYGIKILESVYEGKVREGDDKKPPHLCRVVDLSDGCEYTIIVPAVLLSILVEEIGEYVGRCFIIYVGGVPEGKDYRQFYVDEIEEPDSE